MLSTPPPPKYISAGIGPSPIFMTFFLLLSLPPRLRRKMLHGGRKSQLSNFEGKIAAVASLFSANGRREGGGVWDGLLLC